ncbi:MAG TPA: sigma-70 family RNA polymerase sigma factor [bacterium]|nr:sigma-70 family RNA polymerase sigma factor [bacterium]
MDDHALMKRYAKKGDVAAFELLMSRHRNQVFGYLVQTCRDRELAEDLYQETFIRVIRAAPGYRKTASFRTWLFTIARNLVIDAHRKRKNRPAVQSIDTDGGFAGSGEMMALELTDPGPEELTAGRELRDIIVSAIQALPDQQREMFLLREEAGLDYAEAARIAGCSVNTAKSRMRYALLKIRERIVQEGIVPEEVHS